MKRWGLDKVVLGLGLPRKVPVYFCCPTGIINSSPFPLSDLDSKSIWTVKYVVNLEWQGDLRSSGGCA